MNTFESKAVRQVAILVVAFRTSILCTKALRIDVSTLIICALGNQDTAAASCSATHHHQRAQHARNGYKLWSTTSAVRRYHSAVDRSLN